MTDIYRRLAEMLRTGDPRATRGTLTSQEGWPLAYRDSAIKVGLFCTAMLYLFASLFYVIRASPHSG